MTRQSQRAVEQALAGINQARLYAAQSREQRLRVLARRCQQRSERCIAERTACANAAMLDLEQAWSAVLCSSIKSDDVKQLTRQAAASQVIDQRLAQRCAQATHRERAIAAALSQASVSLLQCRKRAASLDALRAQLRVQEQVASEQCEELEASDSAARLRMAGMHR